MTGVFWVEADSDDVLDTMFWPDLVSGRRGYRRKRSKRRR